MNKAGIITLIMIFTVLMIGLGWIMYQSIYILSNLFGYSPLVNDLIGSIKWSFILTLIGLTIAFIGGLVTLYIEQKVMHK